MLVDAVAIRTQLDVFLGTGANRIHVPEPVSGWRHADFQFRYLTWFVNHLVVWLRRWRGRQSCHIERVWYFFDDGTQYAYAADVDLRIGFGGRDEMFKATITPLAPQTSRLAIVRWVNNATSVVYTRVGIGEVRASEYDPLPRITTLPVSGRGI